MMNRQSLKKLRRGADGLRAPRLTFDSPPPPDPPLTNARLPYAAIQAKLESIDEEHSKRCKDLYQQTVRAIERESVLFNDHIRALYEDRKNGDSPMAADNRPPKSRHESTQTPEQFEPSAEPSDCVVTTTMVPQDVGGQLEWALRYAEDVQLHLSSALRQGKTLHSAAIALENVIHSSNMPVISPLTKLIQDAAVGLSDISDWMNHRIPEIMEISLSNAHTLQYPGITEL